VGSGKEGVRGRGGVCGRSLIGVACFEDDFDRTALNSRVGEVGADGNKIGIYNS
jgi:hypothetical protein